VQSGPLVIDYQDSPVEGLGRLYSVGETLALYGCLLPHPPLIVVKLSGHFSQDVRASAADLRVKFRSSATWGNGSIAIYSADCA
jgi:hypothetical protein